MLKEYRKEEAYKSIAFGSTGGLVGNNNGFQDIPKLLEVFVHGVLVGLPSQATHEDLGVSGVSKLTSQLSWTHALLWVFRLDLTTTNGGVRGEG